MPVSLAEIAAFFSVVAIDVALAGDNALVVGMAAAGLPASHRRRAILGGVVAATVLRILFALLAVHLLTIVGLTLAGGLLLLWVAWKLYREIRRDRGDCAAGDSAAAAPPKTMRQAITQIAVADLSMSLDNVLAVAGAARDHIGVLVAGLALSVGLMGLAADAVSRLISHCRWVAYVGLLVVLYVALSMIWEGCHQVMAALPVPPR